MRSKLIMMTAVALAVGGCHRADVDHPKTDYTSSLLSRMTPGQIDAATVPLAPAQRGPIAANANTADPATDASLAFSNGANAKAAPVPDTSPDGQHAAVLAEELAAQAPDTATGDEIKRKIYEDYAARSFASANANGSATKGSTVNTSSKEPVAQSKASSSSEPVAAQSNAANGNAPMPTENAPRPAS